MKGQLTAEEQTARESARKRTQRKYPIRGSTPCRVCGTTRDEGSQMTRNHIDGNVFNNSSENVEFVCLPCHAEIDTEAGIWGWEGAYREKGEVSTLS